jgi:pimeloyl-ACP methyl ester carboxylesterase
MVHSSHRIGAILAIVLSLLLVAPASAQDATSDTTTFPATPVGEQLAWMIEVINGSAQSLTAADVTARFSPELLSVVPAEQVAALIQQSADAFSPFELEGFTRPPTATQAIAYVTGAGGVPLVVPISVEAAPPHQISGFNLAPVPPPPGTTLGPVADDAGTVVAGEGRLDGLFDIGGGREIYLSCVGSGSPTVILESGSNDSAAPWFAIESAVAPFTRVCSYDRANTVASASDPTPMPRTGHDVVNDLHEVMAAAGVPGPYVFVGHSFGGLFARLYASTYPEEVAGMVLVDASHEDQFARFESLVTPEQWAAFEQMLAQLPDFEGIEFDTIFSEVREAQADAPLQPMPLFVLTAGQGADPSTTPPGFPQETFDQMWQELQADLAELVPDARHVVAEQSGHYIHQSQPDLVVEAIQQVTEAVRDPSTWATPVAATPAR